MFAVTHYCCARPSYPGTTFRKNILNVQELDLKKEQQLCKVYKERSWQCCLLTELRRSLAVAG